MARRGRRGAKTSAMPRSAPPAGTPAQNLMPSPSPSPPPVGVDQVPPTGYAGGGSVYGGDDAVYGSTAPAWGAAFQPSEPPPMYRPPVQPTFVDPYERMLMSSAYGGAGFARGGPVRTGYQGGGEVDDSLDRYSAGSYTEADDSVRRRLEQEAAAAAERKRLAAERQRADAEQQAAVRREAAPADLTGYRRDAETPTGGMTTGYGAPPAREAGASRLPSFSDVLDYLHDSILGKAQAADAAPALPTGYGAGAGGYGGELVTAPTSPQNALQASQQAPTPAPVGAPLSLQSTAPPSISGQADTPAIATLPETSRLVQVERDIAARAPVDTSNMGILEKIARAPGALLERAGDAMRRVDAQREMLTGTKYAISDTDRPLTAGINEALDKLLRGDRNPILPEVQNVMKAISSDPNADYNNFVQKAHDDIVRKHGVEGAAQLAQVIRPGFDNYGGLVQGALANGNIRAAAHLMEKQADLLPNNQKFTLTEATDGKGGFIATVRSEIPGGPPAYSARLSEGQVYDLATRHMQFDALGKTGMQPILQNITAPKPTATPTTADTFKERFTPLVAGVERFLPPGYLETPAGQAAFNQAAKTINMRDQSDLNRQNLAREIFRIAPPGAGGLPQFAAARPPERMGETTSTSMAQPYTTKLAREAGSQSKESHSASGSSGSKVSSSFDVAYQPTPPQTDIRHYEAPGMRPSGYMEPGEREANLGREAAAQAARLRPVPAAPAAPANVTDVQRAVRGPELAATTPEAADRAAREALARQEFVTRVAGRPDLTTPLPTPERAAAQRDAALRAGVLRQDLQAGYERLGPQERAAAKPPPDVPDTAITALVNEPTPARAREFDALFGPGAARRIIPNIRY